MIYEKKNIVTVPKSIGLFVRVGPIFLSYVNQIHHMMWPLEDWRRQGWTDGIVHDNIFRPDNFFSGQCINQCDRMRLYSTTDPGQHSFI